MPGTFQSAANGTFVSAIDGTFQSDMSGTFGPMLSRERRTKGTIPFRGFDQKQTPSEVQTSRG